MERLVDAVSRYLASLDGCQVLIVDDDAAFRGAIAETLRAALGCQVREAGGETDALVKIHRLTPDLVILDLLMPGLDSFEVLNRLRLDQSTAHLPVLVVTGKDLTPADKERLRHGMARVLTKEEYSRQGLLGVAGAAPARCVRTRRHDRTAPVEKRVASWNDRMNPPTG